MHQINRTLIVMATVLISHYVCAQEIRVFSGTDNSPLPYATITNHTHPFIISSDKNGVAKLSVTAGDTVSVTYIGYKTALFCYKGADVQVVKMLQVQEVLPDVTIRNCRKTTEFNYKNSEAVDWIQTGKGTRNVFEGFISIKGISNNVKTAIRLDPSKPNATLKDFSFWIVKERQAPKSSILSPLIISFYEVSDSTNLPGELISTAPIFYFPKKSGKQTINLDSLHIRIPYNGIYVSYQYIMNEEYGWKYETKLRKGGEGAFERDTTLIAYGGLIDGVYAKNFNIANYDAIKDIWGFAANQPVPNNNLRETIKCEATIKYCEVQ